MKYSIVMPYHDRAPQLYRTLLSFRYFYFNRADFEVIIPVDGKSILHRKRWEDFQRAVQSFPDIKIIHFGVGGKITNPAPLYNAGVKASQAERVILTNPECLHTSNILKELDGELREVYVVCACLEGTTIEPEWPSDFDQIRYETKRWFQHSQKRNKKYHWCSCIDRKLYNNLGGFDTNFALGCGYEDDDFVRRLECRNMIFRYRDDLVVIHQPHEKKWRKEPEHRARVQRNKQLYESKWGKK